MPFHIGKKRQRRIQHLGSKTLKTVRHLGAKAPDILVDVGMGLETAGDVGEVASAGLLALGQPELAVPLLAASEVAKFGGEGLSGVGKAGQQFNQGNTVGGTKTLVKTGQSLEKQRQRSKKREEKSFA